MARRKARRQSEQFSKLERERERKTKFRFGSYYVSDFKNKFGRMWSRGDHFVVLLGTGRSDLHGLLHYNFKKRVGFYPFSLKVCNYCR